MPIVPTLFRPALVAAIIVMAGCAAHGARPDAAQPQVIDQQRDEAKAAYVHGDMAHAAALYQALTQAVPHNADLWFRLGNARFRLQQVDDAVAAYEHALRLQPDHARALYNLGVVRLKQAQAAMLASAQAGLPGDPLRGDSGRIAQRLARVGDDVPPRAKGDGGAPPFIVDAE